MVKSSPLHKGSTHELFREFAKIHCELVAAEGISQIPYQSEELPHFSKLSDEKQREVVHQLSETVAVYQEMLAQGLRLSDSPKLLWRSMNRLGIVPGGDVFDKIEKEDIVVIFANDNRQIFRNLEFLRLSIYTLEELYATEWFRYTKRDAVITKKLQELTQDLYTGKKSGTFNPEIDEHELLQLGTAAGPTKLRLQIKFVSPVTADRENVGLLVIEKAWKVE